MASRPIPIPSSAAETADEDIRRIGLVSLSSWPWSSASSPDSARLLFRDLIGLIHNVPVPRPVRGALRRQPVHAAEPLGRVRHPGAGDRRARRSPSSSRPSRPRPSGHGVPEVMDAIYYKGGVIRPGRRGREVARLGDRDRQRRARSGARGRSSRSARRSARRWARSCACRRAAHHPGRGRRRRRHRRDLQHADRRRHVRDRADDARGQRAHLPAGGAGDRHRDLHRPVLLRAAAGLRRAAPGTDQRRCRARRSRSASTRVLGAIIGVAAAGFIRGLHLVEDLFDKIKERYTRHVLGMLLVGVLIYASAAALRPLLRRGRRLRDDPGDPDRANCPAPGCLLLLFVCKLLATSLSLGSGSSGGIFSPSLFMGATIGGAFAAVLDALASAARHRHPGLRHGRHGRDGRRRHRRGDDRGHDDLRDDARLHASSCR